MSLNYPVLCKCHNWFVMSGPPEELYCKTQTILLQQPLSADVCRPWFAHSAPRFPKALTSLCMPGEQCSGCSAPRDNASSALLTFSHLFSSHAVCFGTTVSSQGTPWGHMENEISELICVKNKPGKKKKNPKHFTRWLRSSCFNVLGTAGRQLEGLGLALLLRNGTRHPIQHWCLLLDDGLEQFSEGEFLHQAAGYCDCRGIVRRLTYPRYFPLKIGKKQREKIAEIQELMSGETYLYL